MQWLPQLVVPSQKSFPSLCCVLSSCLLPLLLSLCWPSLLPSCTVGCLLKLTSHVGHHCDCFSLKSKVISLTQHLAVAKAQYGCFKDQSSYLKTWGNSAVWLCYRFFTVNFVNRLVPIIRLLLSPSQFRRLPPRPADTPVLWQQLYSRGSRGSETSNSHHHPSGTGHTTASQQVPHTHILHYNITLLLLYKFCSFYKCFTDIIGSIAIISYFCCYHKWFCMDEERCCSCVCTNLNWTILHEAEFN